MGAEKRAALVVMKWRLESIFYLHCPGKMIVIVVGSYNLHLLEHQEKNKFSQSCVLIDRSHLCARPRLTD